MNLFWLQCSCVPALLNPSVTVGLSQCSAGHHISLSFQLQGGFCKELNHVLSLVRKPAPVELSLGVFCKIK